MWQVSTLGIPVTGAPVGGGNILLAVLSQTTRKDAVGEANEKSSAFPLLCTGSFLARGQQWASAMCEESQLLPPQDFCIKSP